ncbi:AraC family transcriptional regulator [Butyrivibrio proteoclasticus]|uniref:AraC family transcriptional regulator n=1 Tax=Butyrivibrio proteoclasticus TaxID=43305 RepID=UPI00068561FB|nr:AraC family transcriptional regulator [Butyrivibrio proteoclasticus]
MRTTDLDIDRVYLHQITREANYGIIDNHFHCYYELFLVRQGKCRFFIDNVRYDLGPGDFLIIPPKVLHFNRYLAQTLRTNIYFRSCDVTENSQLFCPDLEDKFLTPRVIHIPSKYQSQILSVVDAMLKEENIDDENTAAMQTLLLKEFFLYCRRYCSIKDSSVSLSVAGAEDIFQVVQHINDHYYQPLSLEDLAEVASLSPSYLSKKFYQTMGMGIKKYQTQVRLKHASLELLSTQHSITEIAINCGFSDGNYFKDAFKKNYDISPRAFRKAHAAEYTKEQPILNDKYWEAHAF